MCDEINIMREAVGIENRLDRYRDYLIGFYDINAKYIKVNL